jgi:tRNA(fMet)-specific endonuclease VapC
MARLIDTSVFIELERRGEHLDDLDALAMGLPIALASISASELLIGVHRASSAQRRRRRLEFVETVLSRVPIVPFDERAAETHARLSVELDAIGQPTGPNDLLIAATALTFGYELITHNIRHFRRVPGLPVRETGELRGK